MQGGLILIMMIRKRKSSLDVEGRIKRCLNELAAMGFRIVRDAGGLECIKADAWNKALKKMRFLLSNALEW